MDNTPKYDLEQRTSEFAKRVRKFCKTIPRTVANQEDGRQLIRSSGSIGANYIEANESLSKKDFVMRIKISRKEAKESTYWLGLIDTNQDGAVEAERIDENIERNSTQVRIKYRSALLLVRRLTFGFRASNFGFD